MSGEIIVDARDKVSSQHPKGWTDREEGEKFNKLIVAVRTAFASGGDQAKMNEVLLKAGRELGLNATEAIVIGEASEHWKINNRWSKRFFKNLKDL